MFQIIISSFILSIIHASIPNHWLPLVGVGRVERWSKQTTLWATAVIGTAHVASTILIGLLVGWAGYRLSSSYQYISEFVAPSILILFGVVYLMRGVFGHAHHHHFNEQSVANKSFGKAVFTLSIAMFFSPCVELESYYFTAGTYGWLGIGVVSLVYLVVTVAAMVGLVALAIEGVNRFNFSFLEKHDKTIIGVILILLGFGTAFINM